MTARCSAMQSHSCCCAHGAAAGTSASVCRILGTSVWAVVSILIALVLRGGIN